MSTCCRPLELLLPLFSLWVGRPAPPPVAPAAKSDDEAEPLPAVMAGRGPSRLRVTGVRGPMKLCVVMFPCVNRQGSCQPTNLGSSRTKSGEGKGGRTRRRVRARYGSRPPTAPLRASSLRDPYRPQVAGRRPRPRLPSGRLSPKRRRGCRTPFRPPAGDERWRRPRSGLATSRGPPDGGPFRAGARDRLRPGVGRRCWSVG